MLLSSCCSYLDVGNVSFDSFYKKQVQYLLLLLNERFTSRYISLRRFFDGLCKHGWTSWGWHMRFKISTIIASSQCCQILEFWGFRGIFQEKVLLRRIWKVHFVFLCVKGVEKGGIHAIFFSIFLYSD